MILLRIGVGDKKQAEEIIHLLLAKKLIFSPTLSQQESFISAEETGHIQTKEKFLICGQTKALLFEQINTELSQKYPNNMPLLYALPIVYMDPGQSEELKSATRKI
ncbi:MAG: divalent cation tolerance protein CutA [Eudoraea sp.]|nr:divalent cation tolerance protein CutA [Eudoraea sp.]